jgi:myo-inositol-hexaphosphate 3-phosphohydrolase
MATPSLESLQQDRLAMSVAQAVSVANEAALQYGTDPANSLVTITEDNAPGGRVWRIQYGPRDYIGRRGGDLIVLVEERTGSVQQVIRGQ